MLAFRVERHGGLEALIAHDLPRPTPTADQALVRVRACALNHLDLWVRNGVPGHRFPLPLVPGSEIAGILESAAPGFSVGDPVLVAPGVSCGVCARCRADEDSLCPAYGILGETQDGGYTEFAVVPQRNLIALPAGLSFVEAASIPLAFLTAWHMLEGRARLERTETALIHAAGSGVSSAAIQIARLLGAGRIFVTASSEEKLEQARGLGATDTINYRTEDFAKAVKSATSGAGVDVVVDHVGGEVFEKSLRCLAPGGRIVLCGATAAAEATINLRALFFKNLSILGSTMGSLAELHRLLRHFVSGELRPVIAQVFPLAQARQAQAALESRQHFGKIVLEMEEDTHG